MTDETINSLKAIIEGGFLEVKTVLGFIQADIARLEKGLDNVSSEALDLRVEVTRMSERQSRVMKISEDLEARLDDLEQLEDTRAGEKSVNAWLIAGGISIAIGLISQILGSFLF